MICCFQISVLLLLIFSSSLYSCQLQQKEEKDFIQYVNPFIGTGESGNTTPAASAPFGMISWGPNTNFNDYDYYDARPGYKYEKDSIISFSLTHYNGIGCHAKRDIPFSFTSKQPILSPVFDRGAYASAFAKENEFAAPGEYQVLLDEGNIDISMTSAERSSLAIVRFEKKMGHVIIAPGNNANGVTNAFLEVDPGKNMIKGYATTGGFCDHPNTDFPYTIFFVSVFDKEMDDYGIWEGENRLEKTTSANGDTIAAYISFTTDEDKELKIKTAISYVSMDNAILNLQHEIPQWDYDAVKTNTQNKWNDLLSKIEISSSNPGDYEVFYTAFYRNGHHPNIFEDVNGEYIGFDDQIHKVEEGRHFYVNFSLWDTYRTSVQLQSMLFPERMNDMLHSMLLSARQGGGGLPVWSLNNTDNGCMNGYSGAPFIANALAFGSENVDVQALKNQLVLTAMEEIPIKDSRGWEHNQEYRQMGYVPHPISKSVSKTIEYSIADYAIALVCKAAGDSANYKYFLDRSHAVFNLYNPSNGYLQKKDASGKFIEPFELTDTEGFDEGNTAHYTFGIPHATNKLIDLMGGNEKANAKLDQFFSIIYTTGWNIAEPHYWLGNEPCFGTPFVYNFTGQNWKSQKQIKDIVSMFKTGHEGLPGDEDAGAMSAYYIFGAVGIYPYIPGTGGFLITGPVFEKVKIKLGNGNILQMNAPNAGWDKPYIRSVKVNGKNRDSAWIEWDLLQQGSSLEFDMDQNPHKDWGY